jgi:hypothetical protein
MLPGTTFCDGAQFSYRIFLNLRVFKKRSNFLNSSPTRKEGTLRLLSAPSGRFWQQTAICLVSLWALVVELHPLNWARAQVVRRIKQLETSSVVIALIENYTTSKPLKVSPEKSQVLSCDTCRKWAIYTVNLIIYLSNTQSRKYVVQFLTFRHCSMKYCTWSDRVTYSWLSSLIC